MRKNFAENFRIEARALALRDHDAIRFQDPMDSAVKFVRKQAFGRPDRIRGVDDGDIKCTIGAVGDILDAVCYVQRQAWIAKLCCDFREEFFGRIDHHAVDFHHDDFFDAFIAEHFTGDTTVAAADDEDALGVRVNLHCHVADHLVIDVLVFFSRHDHPV